MRVVIATFDGVERVRALALAWHAAALPAERLHVVADTRVVGADTGAGTDLPLVPVAAHDRWALWVLTGVADPTGRADAGGRGGTRDARRRRRRGLALLGRLLVAGELIGWTAYADALAGGRRLGVVRLERGGDDTLALVRPLLAAASGPVRISDLSPLSIRGPAAREFLRSVRQGTA